MTELTLSAEEQIALSRLAHTGDVDARNRLIECSQGLARQIAFRFARQTPNAEVDDMVQEATFALLDAIHWFDPDRGYTFSTYAGDCIARRLIKHLQKQTQQPAQQDTDKLDEDEAPVDEPGFDPVFKERLGEIVATLKYLPDRQRRVLELRFGIERGGPRNWGDIGRLLGIKSTAAQTLFDDAMHGIRSQTPGLPEPSAN